MATAQTELKVTQEIAAEHGVTAEEYQRIQKILGRDPNITELGIFSVMWSEHCSYKSSKVHLKRLPTRGKLVVQGPGENAGVVDIGDGLVAAFKIESHNHPSYVEPFQGATTGVGGILRDIFTMGARPIAILDSLRFGEIRATKQTTEQEAANNRRILDGVIQGVAHYGNCFGVPTVGGEVVFEPCYSQNPLVNALALGIARKEDLFFARAKGTGNPVIYVGAKTGRDGIHGASLLASAEFTEQSQQKRPNVQVGDPFVEKLLLEACLEAMKTGAVIAIQDMGAAGLTCSTCEMASRGGTGIEIDLAKVPQRETGMTPYEIMLSESQERMLLVAEKGREQEVLNVFKKWGLDATVVGEVKDGERLVVRDHGKVVAEIPAHPLAEDGPVYHRPIAKPNPRQETDKDWFPFAKEGIDLSANFLELLASPTIASKGWITEQYDTMVRTNTLAGPGASDAAVVRVKGTKRALALATDGNGRWSYLDPRAGAMHAVAEAARNVAASGARPIAATNCLNFGSPEKPEVMWQFSQAIDGLGEACIALDTPITGGNVSFYNETLGKSIYPTPTIGMLGLIEDAKNVQKIAFRNAGDVIVLLDGETAMLERRFEEEFSSSEYSKVLGGIVAGQPPAINLHAERRLIELLVSLAETGKVHSTHDLSDGGLAVAVAESCFAARGLGAEVQLEGPAPAEYQLFGEAGARAILSLAPEEVAAIKQLADAQKVRVQEIGKVTRDNLVRIQYKGLTVVSARVERLKDRWANSVERALKLP
ncbi:MAG TPA: phosphoribosylformylglycinamidine synthase subunit PurL [Candidatus Acidoferrum sp.]|nr:phosphoribosylformylglycinamidine synthase subunit PurL [Candidatus Acidoferrum sp.]